MRWGEARRSDNVDDLRGQRTGVGMRAGGMGIGGLLLLMLLTYMVGGDPLALLTQVRANGGRPPGRAGDAFG